MIDILPEENRRGIERNFEIKDILGAVRMALEKQVLIPYGVELKVVIDKKIIERTSSINGIDFTTEQEQITLSVNE